MTGAAPPPADDARWLVCLVPVDPTPETRSQLVESILSKARDVSALHVLGGDHWSNCALLAADLITAIDHAHGRDKPFVTWSAEGFVPRPREEAESEPDDAEPDDAGFPRARAGENPLDYDAGEIAGAVPPLLRVTISPSKRGLVLNWARTPSGDEPIVLDLTTLSQGSRQLRAMVSEVAHGRHRPDAMPPARFFITGGQGESVAASADPCAPRVFRLEVRHLIADRHRRGHPR